MAVGRLATPTTTRLIPADGWWANFVDSSKGVRATEDVEVKWARYPAEDKRSEWTSGDQRTTLVMLISGEFRVDVMGGSTTMTRQGDYVMWGPGVDNAWETSKDSLVLTVR